MGLALALLSLALQDRPEVDAALAAFQADYAKAETEADRASAVRRLAERPHPRVLARLAPLLTADGPAVRIAAAEGLAGFRAQARAATLALGAALAPNEKNDDVQVALMDAMARLRDPAALPFLHAFADHKTLNLARAAVIATGKAGRRESVELLIALLAKHEKVLESNKGGTLQVETDGVRTFTTEDAETTTLRRAAALAPAAVDALRAITKQEIKTARDWSAWWARQREAPAKAP